ncbi:transcriptional Coactivator p15-domain-containing protein [Sordaria brevicollis]|uniref:Transcriptional Coactivator p15-domain-containing protein n=1 Tax=Sordaria brevicollis TaxID=83679 RepID=A0AAE0PMY6_SORBR|nr:transcriptional Coactivator p15-domain-containing protein [Sordaria brevicollis]
MPPKRRQVDDNSDAEPQYAKKSKGNSGKAQPQELTKGSDQDGNTFWELGNNRRISSSAFRNATLINIREYYNADGKMMPGKKGISLSLAQYQNLLKVIPQLNADLRKQGHAIEDPEFAEVAEKTDDPVETPQVKALESKKENKKKPRKSNIDVTSDEEEAAEDEDDDE